jgi:hypothetical protein
MSRKSSCCLSCLGKSYLVGKESPHTHALLEFSCLFDFYMIKKNYLCQLKSQLPFISLFIFEMRSDCVISWLCMCILTLTWENLISINFSKFFWCFSVESPDGIPWSPDGCSMVVRTVFFGSPDMCSASSSGQVLLYFRTHMRCHHRSNG